MTRRFLVALVIAAALFVPATASAAPPEGSLHLSLQVVNEGELGPQSFFFAYNAFEGTNAVGSLRGDCHFRGRFENPHCRLTFSLPGGKLFAFLRITPDPRGSFKVTGGTGTYRGRTGVGIYRDISETTTNVTIWLTSQRVP